MGRSVNVPHDAVVVTYMDVSEIEDDFIFEDELLYITETLKDKMPSLADSDRWFGNEGRVILENDLAFIGISTYGGIMSLWVIPRDEYLALAQLWIWRIAHHIRELGNLTKDGTMSNGVSVYSYKGVKKNE